MRRKSITRSEERLRLREYLGAVGHVLKVVFKISPLSIAIKLLGGVFDAVLPLATAFFAAQTITEMALVFSGDVNARNRALLYVGLTAVFGLLSAVQSTVSSYIDEVMRFKVEAKVSDLLYERFVQMPFWRYEDKTTVDLYDKAQEFTRFFAYVFDRIMNLATSLLGVATAVVGLMFVSPLLGLLFVAAIVPQAVTQYKLTRLNIDHWRSTVTARRKQSFIEYNMIQPKIISELRLYNLAGKMLDLRKHFRSKDQGARLAFEKRFIGWRLLGNILEAAAQLGALVWAVVQISAQALPIGQFVYIQQLASRALGSISRFVSEYSSADEDLAKLKDYNDFMQLPLEKRGARTVPQQISSIRFEHVSFHYPGDDRPVLQDISLTITMGDHIAIVGENGAGKTTFVKLLLGFYEPTEGVIFVDDIPLSEYDIASWHSKIGVLLQNYSAYHFLTAGENVSFGDVKTKPTRQRISKALEEAEALEMVESLPKKLDTPMAPWLEEEGATDLSGGQWQRLGLARNFYRQAPIVILDEPTSAIDALAEAKIFDRLYDKENKRTIIAISHRLTTIEQADQIYVFKDGTIVQQGTHKELAAQKSGQYAHMFRRQLKNS